MNFLKKLFQNAMEYTIAWFQKKPSNLKSSSSSQSSNGASSSYSSSNKRNLRDRHEDSAIDRFARKHGVKKVEFEYDEETSPAMSAISSTQTPFTNINEFGLPQNRFKNNSATSQPNAALGQSNKFHR
jgi:hypothetical protein